MKNLLAVIMLISFVSASQGQKLKYKDIFPLIKSKNYKQAERKLKSFLGEEKNANHPHANLAMGMIWQDKLNVINGYKERNKFEEVVSTAVSYYEKSKGLITEKEVSKNDEYYSEYNRRDLRTGKYGVKVSDVVLDIDARIEVVKEAKKNLIASQDKLKEGQVAYEKIQSLFLSIKDLAKTERSFTMRSANSPETVEKLYEIKTLQPNINGLIDEAEAILKKLPKKPFEVKREWKPIEDFTEDGITEPQFIEGNFQLWDYAPWCEKMIDMVENEVRPFIGEAVKYNMKLNSELKRVMESQYMEYTSLTKDLSEAPLTNLAKLKKNPYPEKLFNAKLKELPVLFYLNTNVNPSALDTADVDYQVWYSDTLLSVVNEYDSVLRELENARFSFSDWAWFLDSEFKDKQAYHDYILEKKNWATTLKKAWKERSEAWLEKSKWGVQEADKKPIPMFSVSGMSTDIVYQYQYLTMDAMLDSITGNYYVLGVEILEGDKKKGFVAGVSNARKVLWKKNITLGKVIFGGSEIDAEGRFIDTEEDMLTFYLYTPSQGVTQNMMFAKTDALGAVKWRTPYVAQSKPQSFAYDPQAKEISVYFGEKEDPSTYVFKISSNGKIVGLK